MDRVNDILFGPLERPALAWLCRRMPSRITPDQLTVVGVGGGVLTLLGYGLTNLDRNFLWLACAGLVLNWLGDSLDGSLARFRGIERPRYGFFLDHMSDAFVTVMVCVGVGLSAYVDMVYALVALAGYLLMSLLTYVTGLANGVFRLSYGKVGPTEIRLIIIGASIGCYFVPNPVLGLGGTEVRLFELVTLGIGVLLMGACAVATFTTSRALARLDPKASGR
jgi:archaetidylinositol phosphate synthase